MSDLKAIFDTNAVTIEDIFLKPNGFYVIPDYQRQYSWEDEQIEQLFDDVHDAMQSKTESYFLGPIILISTDPKKEFEIVDGQQRLTTLVILFSVLRDYFFKDDSYTSDEIAMKVRDSIKSPYGNKYRLRLITQAHNQTEFEEKILKKVVIPDEKNKDESKFVKAAIILYDKIKELENEKGKEEVIRFANYLLTNVSMVNITCFNRAYAIRLFQTINTRGLDLTPSDLIKSSLYERCANNELKAKQFTAEWSKIEELANQVGETLTDLLTYYEYYLLASNPERSLYEELEIKFKGEEPTTVLFDFENFIKKYKEIYEDQSKDIIVFKYLRDKVYWKSVLTSAKYSSYKDFDVLAKELKKLYYMNWIAGYTVTRIKQISFNLIGWVKNSKPIEKIKEEIQAKIQKDNLIGRFSENINDDVYKKPWLKPILMMLEYELADPSKKGILEIDKIQIDHILPVAWKEIKEWQDNWTEELANELLNKIGNLTLLYSVKNDAQKNTAPLEKRKFYEDYLGKTPIILSQMVIDGLKEGWTSKNVEERQKLMINELNKMFKI
jgi:uncharacterized protein with ParB-like and HNH nuclease domain